MEERVLTRHPLGKKGVNISKRKYDAMRAAIIDTLAAGDTTHTDLVKGVEQRLQGGFDGSVKWYVETVKLDLEARGAIERIPKTSPQLLRLTP